jgi:hypothetical protein
VPDLEFVIGSTGGQQNINLGAVGVKFTNGIVIACTTAEFGNTAVGNGIHVNTLYQ